MKIQSPHAVAVILIATGCLISSPPARADAPDVAGVVGMTPVTEQSCAAVWLPVGEGKALSGLMWYNNDRLVEFPEILVASGGADDPATLDEATVVAEAVIGGSSTWSAVTFSEPVASAHGGFYVLFRFPAGSEQTAEGAGGGAGIGFVDGGGCSGWLTADGEDWVKVGRSYGFAVLPQFTASAPGMLTKATTGTDPDDRPTDLPQVTETALLPATPNPFNPSTDIRFALKDASRVKVRIFDVRGRRVIDLVDEEYPAGEHAVTWTGRDQAGQRVSSGVYLVQFTAGNVRTSRRIMMVK